MIITTRLDLVPGTPEFVRAALTGGDSLQKALGATVPESWPPDYLDAAAFEFTLQRLAEGPEQTGWWLYFVVLREGPRGRILIGSGGFKGPPSKDGMVEVGYGIVKDHHRQGYASEVVSGLLGYAFDLQVVRLAIAETLPELAPSIGVLRKSHFRFVGPGSEAGVIRFEMTRQEYLSIRGKVAAKT